MMRRVFRLFALALAVSLAACSAGTEPQASRSDAGATSAPSAAPKSADAPISKGPDIAACKPFGREEYKERAPSGPLRFPAKFKGIVTARPDRLAVLTLGGHTLCTDARWQDNAADAALSGDGRFFSYEWTGYEAFGHVIIDRGRAGQVIETGRAPLWSPKRTRFATMNLDESGFGAFDGFAVWEVSADSVQRISLQDANLPTGDWQVAWWKGEDCVTLSVLPSDAVPNEDGSLGRVPRDFWYAAAGEAWKLNPGSCKAA